jgi:hypothetical protein
MRMMLLLHLSGILGARLEEGKNHWDRDLSRLPGK